MKELLPDKKMTGKSLLKWFSVNKRELPWREERTPYKTWISEIILQQTRVLQGLPYFNKFLAAFPDVHSLANASEDTVLKLWQGLGYYSRARNLHHTAKIISSRLKGNFPDTYDELIKLKGIGDYTASAILSINFNQGHAVLDGNVYRVISRLYNYDLAINTPVAAMKYKALATNLLDKKEPGNFNEAIMELGALICTPKNPQCSSCPLKSQCCAVRMGTVEQLPIKLAKSKVSKREINYLFMHNSKVLYLKKREGTDIWKGLYDFPEIELPSLAAEPEPEYGLHRKTKPYQAFKHKLSHRDLTLNFFNIPLKESSKSIVSLIPDKAIAVKFNDLKKYPVPKPLEIFLKDFLDKAKL